MLIQQFAEQRNPRSGDEKSCFGVSELTGKNGAQPTEITKGCSHTVGPRRVLGLSGKCQTTALPFPSGRSVLFESATYRYSLLFSVPGPRVRYATAPGIESAWPCAGSPLSLWLENLRANPLCLGVSLFRSLNEESRERRVKGNNAASDRHSSLLPARPLSGKTRVRVPYSPPCFCASRPNSHPFLVLSSCGSA